MKKTPLSGSSTIIRRHSMNTAPMSMLSMGRSNTAPLPDNESPKFYNDKSKKIFIFVFIYNFNFNFFNIKLDPYLNYSIVSEPETYSNKESRDLYPNTSMILEAQNENGELSLNPCLPTEFDMRPELTPTGEDTNTISFETPVVRSSPSQMSQNRNSEEEANDSDETLEQVSEIVDQTPSTYQNKDIGNCKKIDNVGKKPKSISCGKKFCIMLCTSVLSAFIIVVIITGIIIMILETDSEMFVGIRKLPEMIIFQRDYYQPIKKNILQSIR